MGITRFGMKTGRARVFFAIRWIMSILLDHVVMDENNVGPELEVDNQRRNPGHVANDPQDVGCRRSTRVKFTSSKLHGFETENGYKYFVRGKRKRVERKELFLSLSLSSF